MTLESTSDLETRLEISRRAVEQLEFERERLEGLLLRLPALLAELDPGRLAAGVTEAAREIVGARFALFVPAGGEGHETVLVGLGPEDFTDLPAVDRAPVLGAAAVGGEILRVNDVAAWAPSEGAARAYGVLADGRIVRSWLAAPVRSRGEALGVMYLGHHRAHAFSARQERLVDGLCSQLGAALQHAALFAERSVVARALSESLLPPLLPRIAGLQAAARYRASGTANLVGGDFYDLFELGEGRFGLMLGDVSGVGPEAAALTGVARYTVRAVAPDASAPSEVLARLNEALLAQNSERFLTAVYATIRPGTMTETASVSLCSGGHPPAIVLRDDESVEVLDRATGTLLGVLPDVELTDRELALGPGDALVLVTDGVLEARDDAGEEFGGERLATLLATCAGRSAEGIARRIERAVLDHRGDRAEDDLAVVVLRAEGT